MLRTLWQQYNAVITRIGAEPTDDQEARLRKAMLVGATLVFVPMGILWSALYVFFGELLAGAIPVAFAAISLFNVAVFSLRRNYRLFSFSEMLLILIFPFCLWLVLGGGAGSSAVIAWSFLCPLAALLFDSPRAAVRWTIAYLALIELGAFLEPVLRAENALPQSVQRTFFVFNLGGVSLLSFILLNYFISQKNAVAAMLRTTNALLGQEVIQRTQVEKQLRASREELRALSARMHAAREEERTRISRELHDELGQALTVLKIELAWLHARIDTIPAAETRRAFGEKHRAMLELIDGTIHSLRRIATDLRPSVLDRLGLLPAIEWQMQEFQSHTGIPCTLTACPESVELSTERSTAVFRIFQEVLTNVARHSQANRVHISLEKTPNELILQVRDNGIGITKINIANGQSLGLLGMRERALLFGGEVNIHGMPGEGTTIAVRIPARRSSDRSSQPARTR